MKTDLLMFLFLFASVSVFSQKTKTEVISPNKKINVGLVNAQSNEVGSWYLKVDCANGNRPLNVIPRIDIGLQRSDQPFVDQLKFVKAGKATVVNDQYIALHGKRRQCANSATEVVFSFETPKKAKLNLVVRAYNDGVAFRYEFPETAGTYTINDECTAYSIPDSTKRWLQKFNPANEGLYAMAVDGTEQKDWAYPALFNTPDQSCWFLIHEADLDRTYCGTKLTNYADKTKYKLTFPDEWNGRGKGESKPTISLPWKSPWRVAIIGTLADIVESTLVDDVSTPSVLAKTDWIEPGVASWNYWSDNHGTRSYKTVCQFADLAANMGWRYTLLDWEWDAMADGENLEDALRYIHSLGVSPLIWYNSGGDHNWVDATPKDRMLTHESRMEEFAKLNKLGVAGVKIDFFESEKQNMIAYYLDILDDAAKFDMMVYFHGCIVPRGWARTYPHLMTFEAVRGAEWYNNGPEFTSSAPVHNTILPFTRNVVGAMDYTPVTFTNSQYPHTTSYAHELALSVLFESGIQHFADRPAGYQQLPDVVKFFLHDVPNAWDDVKYISGYPGQDVVLARRKGNAWYIGGANAEQKEKTTNVSFGFLPQGAKYKLTLIADGKYDSQFSINNQVVDSTSHVDVKMLRRGGFVMRLSPME